MRIFLIGDGNTVEDLPSSNDYYMSLPENPNNLRLSIAELTTCDAIVLLDDWWTTSEGHMLQTIAAWLRLGVQDLQGNKLPTSSLRG